MRIKLFEKSLKGVFYNLSFIYLLLRLRKRLPSFAVLIIFCTLCGNFFYKYISKNILFINICNHFITKSIFIIFIYKKKISNLIF
ncbi:unnamed protein product [Brugia timori]|uniref:Uncharacterized protein n=1 Tax=Brugia timori TaxID=42155 RepID=A0A0R3R8L7_9BILA|nr:unnamed protein product [Brugia timori]